MSDREIEAFLDDQRTGVLSLAKADDAYGIPVSFTDDGSDRALYVRLGYGADSRKREYVDAVETVSFATYDRIDGRWRSVVARDRPAELSRAEDLRARYPRGTSDAAVEQALKDLESRSSGCSKRIPRSWSSGSSGST